MCMYVCVCVCVLINMHMLLSVDGKLRQTIAGSKICMFCISTHYQTIFQNAFSQLLSYLVFENSDFSTF
jgi:hypothetical protein